MQRRRTTLFLFLLLALDACSDDDVGSGDTAPNGDVGDVGDVDILLEVDLPDVPVPAAGGLLLPPVGRSADRYEAGNEAGDRPVASDGSFDFGDPGTGVKVTVATPDDAADEDLNVLMAVTVSPPGEPAPAGMLISARTTAVALAFLSPLVATHDSLRARAIIEVAPLLPEVEHLAALVQSRYGTTRDPFADPDFAAARDAAITALAVAAAQYPSESHSGGPRATDRAGTHEQRLDPDGHVDVTVEGRDVIIETRAGVPLASIFRLEQVDVDALHRADPTQDFASLLLSSAQADAVRSVTRCDAPFYPSFVTVDGTRTLGHTSGDSYFGRLDLAGQLVDFVFEQAIEKTASVVGLDLAPEGKLPIDTSRPGLYVLRAFNGLRGDGVDCGEKAFAEASFGVEERSAFALNLTLTAFDVLAFVVDARDYWGSCVAEEVQRSYGTTSSYDGSWEDLWDLFGESLRLAGSCVSNRLLDFVSDQGQEAAIKAGKRVGRVVRTFGQKLANKTTFTKIDDLLANLLRKLDPFAYAAIGGTVVDRLWTLYGGGKSALAWVSGGYFGRQSLSPVDTWLIRVGDPFGPRVGTVEVAGLPTGIILARERQILVRGGTQVTLIGANLTDNGAPLGDVILASRSRRTVRATPSSPSPDRIVFTVPEGLADIVAVELTTPDGRVPVGEILVIEPELTSLTPGYLFRVARDGSGAMLYPVGGDYVPEIDLRGQGFEPQWMTVRPVGGDDDQVFTPKGGSSDRRLLLGDDPDVPPGEYALELDTGITSPSFLAKYPDGRVPIGLSVKILGPPTVATVSPEKVANGQVFVVTGDNFGDDLEAVALEVLDNPTPGLLVPLDVFFVSALPGGSGIQPAQLSARMNHMTRPAWKEGTPPLRLRLRTPAGEVVFSVPHGDARPPIQRRRVAVYEPSGWAKATQIVSGTYAGADLAQVFKWNHDTEPHPNGEDIIWWCRYDPLVGEWELDDDGEHAVGVSRPPATEAAPTQCGRVCLHEGQWITLSWDSESKFLYDPTNEALGLPTTPCPSSWAGIAPAEINQGLFVDLPEFDLPPATILAYDLGLQIHSGGGGGLRFQGFAGRSQLTGEIKIDRPSVSDPNTPLITLENIEGVDLKLDLRGATNCNIGVKIKNAKDVRIQDPEIEGCKVGFDIEGSTGVVIQQGTVRGYGDDGVGILIRASSGVRITRTRVRPDYQGDSSGVSASARGVVVSEGSSGVRVTVEARKNYKGIEVLDARDVVVGGWIGAARDGSDAGSNSANVFGIDIVGPASDIHVGGNPAKAGSAGATGETTIVIDNGRVGDVPGAGIRLGDVDRVKVSRAYIGVDPGHADEGNRVGIEVLPDAKNVVIERCHIGDNEDAGVEVRGATGVVSMRDTLFAGPAVAGWNRARGFPIVAAGFPDAARCTPAALPIGGDGFDPDAAPAYIASTGGPAARVANGSADVAFERVTSLGGALVVDASTRVRMSQVDVWGNPGFGIALTKSADIDLSAVQIWRCGESGLYIDGSTGVRFEGCAAANGLAGIELTGDPHVPQGGFDGGRKAPPPSGSVIVDPTPELAEWLHLVPRLKNGATAVLLVENGSHGLWAHVGSVPVSLSDATVVGNLGDGVHIEAYDAEVVVRGSAIGALVAAGADSAYGNQGAGVRVIAGSAAVLIGDKLQDGGNVVSGNGEDGIAVEGGHEVRIRDCFIGTDDTGLSALGNQRHGVYAKDAGDLHIGDIAGHANVIGGNEVDGIFVDPGATSRPARIRHNRIGIDANAGLAIGNIANGISVLGCGPRDTAPHVIDNLIAGNGADGVLVTDCSGDLKIFDNGIGGGNLGDVPNGGDGIVLIASDYAHVYGNLVRAGDDGIVLDGSDYVRIDANVVLAVGGVGVRISGGSRYNRVRDAIIRESGGDGIRVSDLSFGNQLTQNSISGNGGKAIALSGGGNLGMPAPALTFADPSARSGTWRVAGVVAMTMAAQIELFADPQDEARVPLTFQPAFSADGRWSFEYVLEPPPTALAPQTQLADLEICATATDFLGNTSEVGCARVPTAACPVAPAPPAETTLAGDVVTSRAGELVSEGREAAARGFARTSFTGVSGDASALVPGGGEAAVCGAVVVFSGGAEGTRELAVHDYGASQSRALAASAGDDVEPSFAPDCSTIAFASNRSGSWDVYEVAIGGGDVHQVTSDAEEDRDPEWVRGGGSGIVFARRSGQGEWGLYRTSGGPPQVFLDEPGDEREPAWHPALGRVAYVRCSGDGGCRLRVFDPDGGLDTPIGPASCDDRDPAWVIDGATTALLVSRRSGDRSQVVLLSSSGTPLWGVTGTATDDGAPACCLPAP